MYTSLAPEAAVDAASVCSNGDGCCATVYESILAYQGVSSADFRHAVFETLHCGRRKGNALMIVGGPDTGKTTITEPAAHVYKTMGAPQADSFCPLQNLRGHELFLWHDFRYAPGHPRKDEQGLRLDEGTWNRLLEGLPTLIGVPKTDGSRTDFVYNEDGAFIFTGPFKLQAYKDGRPDSVETAQLSCRLKYVEFARAAPDRQNREFKPCGLCWSRWLLRGECAWRASHGVESDDFAVKVRTALPAETTAAMPPAAEAPSPRPTAAPRGAVFEQLAQLMTWRAQGMLTDEEFTNAKRLFGLS